MSCFASGCLEIASTAYPVAIPCPNPAPIPPIAAIPAPNNAAACTKFPIFFLLKFLIFLNFKLCFLKNFYSSPSFSSPNASPI